MPDIGSLASFAGQGLGGQIKSIAGLIQMRKANKLLKNLQYPTEQLPGEEVENTNLLRQQAATGLPSQQYAQAMKNIQRQQMMSIMGGRDRRGGLGILPQVQQATNDATLNLDVADAKMRVANQNRLIAQNARVGTLKRDLFDKNIRSKYNRDYQYAMALKGMGNQNAVAGLDQMLGAGVSAAGSAFGGYGGSPQYGGLSGGMIGGYGG